MEAGGRVPGARAAGDFARGDLLDGTAVVLAGRFVLYEGNEPSDVSLNGTVEMRAFDARFGPRVEVPVVDGRFEIKMASGEGGLRLFAGGEKLCDLRAEVRYFTVNPPDLDGMDSLLMFDPAAPERLGATPKIEPGTSEHTMALRRYPVVHLDVVAEGTETRLAEVDVFYVESDLFTAVHPDSQLMDLISAEPLVELAAGKPSPVELRPAGRAIGSAGVVIVGARGHAWERVTLNLAISGKRLIELAPAGSVRIDYDGIAPEGSEVRLYEDGWLFADLPLTSETIRLTGVKPGTYRVSIEVGDWFSAPSVVGEQEVTIIAGQESAVVVELLTPRPEVTAPLSGTLVVPTAWETSRSSLTLKQLSSSADGVKAMVVFKDESLTPIPGRDGHYAFEVPEVEVGTYSLHYEPLKWAQDFEHGPEGTRDYRFELPQPKTVTLRVDVEGATESTEPVGSVYINYLSSARKVRFGGSRVDRDAESGVFSFQVATGGFSVCVMQSGIAYQYAEFDTANGENFFLGVQRSAKCTIELQSDGVLLPWPDVLTADVTDPTGAIERRNLVGSGLAGWLTLKGAGIYRIEGLEVEGFLPSEPVTVEAALGESRAIVIELTSK